jgi:hypothetical protein
MRAVVLPTRTRWVAWVVEMLLAVATVPRLTVLHLLALLPLLR